MTVDPTTANPDEIREAVRERYAGSALRILNSETTSCCGPDDCGPITRGHYDAAVAADATETALLASLGCGNPTALADLRPGEVVLDLGSGGGLDVLLSAKRVAPGGRAIGLDMTDEMLELARRNQAEAGVENVEFIKGTIESIPLPDSSVDVIISNCVINLAADKDVVLREAHRVLRAEGRFAVSDMVLVKQLPAAALRATGLWTGCVAGALLDSEYVSKLAAAGFSDAEVELTRVLTASDLEEMGRVVPDELIPEGMTHDELVASMDGAIANAFIRAKA